MIRLVLGVLGCALALTACSSDDPPPADPTTPAAAGGDVSRVPGQVVDADSIAVSPDGGSVAAGCGDELCVWSTGDGSLTATYDGGNVVAWSPDGTLLATSGFSGRHADVVLVAPEDGAEAGRAAASDVPAGEDAVGIGLTALAFSPDGTLLASTGADGAVRLWSVPGLDPVSEIDTAGDDPRAVVFSPDGSRIAVSSADTPLQTFGVDSGDETDDEFVPARRVASTYRFASAPDGTLAWTAARSNTVHAGSMELVGHQEQPRAVAWSPDGETVYSASAGEGIFAWDPATGELVREFELPGG